MNILGITLARGGSKGIKNKNVKDFNGEPLINYTIKEAMKSKLISDYIISSDSKDIINHCNSFKDNLAPFLRPSRLAKDNSKSVDALIHATIKAEKLFNKKYDYIVELMVTNPLKNVSDIEGCLKLAIKKKVDSVIAVHRIYDQHPDRVKKIINGKLVDFCTKEKLESRRQDLKPEAYIRSGSIYVISRNALIQKKLRYIPDESLAYILPENRVINIDNIYDFYLAEIIHRKTNEN